VLVPAPQAPEEDELAGPLELGLAGALAGVERVLPPPQELPLLDEPRPPPPPPLKELRPPPLLDLPPPPFPPRAKTVLGVATRSATTPANRIICFVENMG